MSIYILKKTSVILRIRSVTDILFHAMNQNLIEQENKKSLLDFKVLSNGYWLQGKTHKNVKISINNHNTLTRILTTHIKALMYS